MEVLDSVIFSSSVPKMLELGEEYIINGHVYNKNPITPKILEFVNVTSDNNIYLNTTMFIKNNMISENLSNKMYTIDNQNSNIYYSVTKNKLIKYAKINNKIEVENQTTLSSGIYEIVYQNKYSIWIKGSYNKTSILLGYSKNNLTNIFSKSFANSRLFLINAINDNLYFLISDIVTYIYKLSTITLVLDVLITDNLSNYRVWSSPTILKNNSIFIFQNGGNNILVLKKYIFDFNANTVSKETISLSKEIRIPENNYAFYDTFLFTEGKEDYINLCMYSTGTSNLLNNYHSVYSFDSKFNFTGNLDFSPINYRGFLTYGDNKFLIFANDYNIDFFEWNKLDKQFKQSASLKGNFQNLGIDSNNNIWLQNTDFSTGIASPFTTTEILADFLEQKYVYNGENIESEVVVACKNYSGEFLTTNVKLRLWGNVVFTENNQKITNKTTNNQDFLRIPITITGSGNFEIFASLE